MAEAVFLFSYYQLEGECLDENNPGAGLIYRSMKRQDKQFCTLDGQNGKCILPSARAVSNTLEDILDLIPPIQFFAPIPSVLSLFWGQLNIHDTAQGQNRGKSQGSKIAAACDTNNRNLPRELQSPYVRSIEVDCDDPFYSTVNVKCLDFTRFRTLNEDCYVEHAEPVRSLNSDFQIYFSIQFRSMVPLLFSTWILFTKLSIQQVELTVSTLALEENCRKMQTATT